MSLADEIYELEKALRKELHDLCERYRGKKRGEPLSYGEIIETLEMVKLYYVSELFHELEHGGEHIA